MFDRADLKGRMTMLNDMRETIGAALKSLGYSLNTTERRRARRGPRRRHPLEEEPRQVRERAVQDRPRLGRVPAGPRLQRRHPPGAGRERGHRLRHARRRGRSISCDDLVIPQGREGSRRSPTRSSTSCTIPRWRRRTPTSSATSARTRPPTVLPAEYPATNPASSCPAIRAKCEVIGDLGEDNAKYTKVWDEIKAAP